jgi:hypothetical protein
MQQNDVLYVYHNVIDKTGDSPTTEAKTADAVEEAFRELLEIVKKVPNLNVSNMLLVSDHGFLFQQDDVSDEDHCAYPLATEWLNRNRRFAIGYGIQKSTDTITFSAEQLNLTGSWSCAFPASLGRFPLQGSGKRYVHGGYSLQEVIIPVVHINKSRVDDTLPVNVEILRIPSRITTGQLGLSLFQVDAVSNKILPRTLRIGLFAKDGTPLSDSRTIHFDLMDNEVRNREKSVVLMLSKAADRFNNTTVEIRILEVVAGTTQEVTYQTHDIRIQKSFDNDFDEL